MQSDLPADIELFLADRRKHYGIWSPEEVSTELTRLIGIAR